MNSHEQRLDNNEDDINRLRYANDLRLIGIPHVQNENLVQIFQTLASIIGYDSVINATKIMERLPARNKITGIVTASPTILLHFTTIQHKNWFYSLYLGKMPIKSEAFGLKGTKNIILGENLTRKNAAIFKLAQNMKSEKKIAQVFTMDGLVKVKFVKGPNQRTFTTRSIIELENLTEQHNHNAMDVETHTDTQNKNSQTNNQTTHTNLVGPHNQVTLNTTAQSQLVDTTHPLTHPNGSEHHLNTSIELLDRERQQQQQQNAPTSTPRGTPNG